MYSLETKYFLLYLKSCNRKIISFFSSILFPVNIFAFNEKTKQIVKAYVFIVLFSNVKIIKLIGGCLYDYTIFN
jgi:hypothetical protein